MSKLVLKNGQKLSKMVKDECPIDLDLYCNCRKMKKILMVEMIETESNMGEDMEDDVSSIQVQGDQLYMAGRVFLISCKKRLAYSVQVTFYRLPEK